MISPKTKVLAFNIGLLGIITAVGLYLAGVIPQSTMWTVLGFFGSGSIAALRALFMSEGQKTNLVFVIGSLLQAIFLYGNLSGYMWASPEKLTLLNQVLLGVQGINAGHGIAKANGNSELNARGLLK